MTYSLAVDIGIFSHFIPDSAITTTTTTFTTTTFTTTTTTTATSTIITNTNTTSTTVIVQLPSSFPIPVEGHFFEGLRHKTGGSGFDPPEVLGIFQVACSFCPHSVALGSTQPLTEMSTKEFPWG